MSRILIVNADDCNLTPGVTEAILECHDQGIVSSTTWMVNLPHNEDTVMAVKSRKDLGVGLHLNVTLGSPVTEASKLDSLVTEEGLFKKKPDQLQNLPSKDQLLLEYENQIQLFKYFFGELPTHLDTHHQLHDELFFLTVLQEIALKHELPIRRSKLMNERVDLAEMCRTSDYLLGDLDPNGHWRKHTLEDALENLNEGISEVMCHPGKNDKDLQAISSFTKGREQESSVLKEVSWKSFLQERDIQLSHYGLCYT